MHRKHFALFVLLITSATGAHGKQIYRIVGPDGKVSFSDTAPENSAEVEKYSIKDGPSTPISATPSASQPSSAIRKSQAKQATAASPTTPAAAQPTSVDPALEKAVIGVLGYEDLINQTEQLCQRVLPTSFRKYAGAADGWRSRNASVVRQARSALAGQFSSAQQQVIQESLRARNSNSLAKVVAAPAASQISWCDSSSNEIQNGGMDPANKPNLAGPLVGQK